MSEMTRNPKSPVVLCFSAHDATGASGMAADIEAIVSQGCHANTVVTCLSVQDSQMVSSLIPIDDDIIVHTLITANQTNFDYINWRIFQNRSGTLHNNIIINGY